MITFTDEEWAIMHDFLSTTLRPAANGVLSYDGYHCLGIRIRYGKLTDEKKARMLAKLGMK